MLVGILTCWLLACNKETSNTSSTRPAGTQTLTLSNLTVKQGQPLVASLPAGVSSASVRWSVNPDSTARIKVDSGHATILFTRAGTYRISANYATGTDTTKRDSCTGTILVSDSTYNPPPPSVPLFDTVATYGDSLYITPRADSGGLILHVQSSRHYGCSPYYLYWTAASVDTGLNVHISSVVKNHSDSCGSSGPATAEIYLKSSINSWPNGTYHFSVFLSGGYYTGTLAITGTDYTFTWNNNAPIFISPLHVTR